MIEFSYIFVTIATKENEEKEGAKKRIYEKEN